MSVEALRLVNFRGFEKGEIELAPLTVILGPNSAGKSTFGQALVALAQIQTRGVGHPDLARRSDETIDVGGFSEAAHNDASEFTLAMRVPAGWVELGFGRPYRNGPELIPLRRVRLPLNAVTQTGVATHELSPPAVVRIATSATGVAAPLREQTLVRELSRDPDDSRVWNSDDGSLVTVAFEGLVIQSILRSDTRSVVHHPEVALLSLVNYLGKIRYLGADRVPPLRQYPPTAGVWIGSAGEHAAGWLHAHSTDSVRMYRPPALPADRDDARALMSHPSWPVLPSVPVLDAVALWLRHLELAHSVGTQPLPNANLRLDVTLSPKHPPRTPLDVGHGVSQALAVILGALATPSDGTFIVEQPEGQLHPRAQAALADLFCSHVHAGKRAIVETHSETFFRRLRVRASVDPELDKKIAVYFVDRGSERCCEPKRINLTDPAGIQWPEGFLAETMNEELAALTIAAVRAGR